MHHTPFIYFYSRTTRKSEYFQMLCKLKAEQFTFKKKELKGYSNKLLGTRESHVSGLKMGRTSQEDLVVRKVGAVSRPRWVLTLTSRVKCGCDWYLKCWLQEIPSLKVIFVKQADIRCGLSKWEENKCLTLKDVSGLSLAVHLAEFVRLWKVYFLL